LAAHILKVSVRGHISLSDSCGHIEKPSELTRKKSPDIDGFPWRLRPSGLKPVPRQPKRFTRIELAAPTEWHPVTADTDEAPAPGIGFDLPGRRIDQLEKVL
jgi:hypothetical protein